jgi:hypothetical protein
MTVQERPGLVLILGDADYRYGVGPLALRVEYIDVEHPFTFDGELWYTVHGIQLGTDGVERGPRSTLVRGCRIPGMS